MALQRKCDTVSVPVRVAQKTLRPGQNRLFQMAISAISSSSGSEVRNSKHSNVNTVLSDEVDKSRESSEIQKSRPVGTTERNERRTVNHVTNRKVLSEVHVPRASHSLFSGRESRSETDFSSWWEETDKTEVVLSNKCPLNNENSNLSDAEFSSWWGKTEETKGIQSDKYLSNNENSHISNSNFSTWWEETGETKEVRSDTCLLNNECSNRSVTVDYCKTVPREFYSAPDIFSNDAWIPSPIQNNLFSTRTVVADDLKTDESDDENLIVLPESFFQKSSDNQSSQSDSNLILENSLDSRSLYSQKAVKSEVYLSGMMYRDANVLNRELGISDFETPPCSKVRRRMRKKFERDAENSESAEDSDYQQGSKSVSALDYLNEVSPSPKLKTTISKSCSEVGRKSKERSGTPASLKRSYSETFSGEDDKNTHTPKQEVDSLRKLQIMGSTPRSSLSKHSSKRSDESHRRKSYPTNKSYDNHERRCLTDQTPYRNEESPDDRQKRQKTILPRYSFWDLPRYESKIGFIDSHCHLDFLFQRQDFEGTYEEYQTKYKSSYPPAYQGCIAVFCNPFTFSQKSLWRKLLKEENVWASFGCHPHNAKDYNDKVESQLCEALEHPRVRALGEIGLDYSNRNNCLKEQQHSAFQRQLKIAIKKSLPLVIHCRQAQEDCIRIMKEIVPDDYFIHLHCFTDTWSWAKKWLDTFPNLFIGITNVVTFPSAETVHEVAKNIPLDRLLLETDAPYFVPRPIAKGSRWSHPGMAIHVAAQIAAIKNNISLDEVFYFTRENTRKMYNI